VPAPQTHPVNSANRPSQFLDPATIPEVEVRSRRRRPKSRWRMWSTHRECLHSIRRAARPIWRSFYHCDCVRVMYTSHAIQPATTTTTLSQRIETTCRELMIATIENRLRRLRIVIARFDQLWRFMVALWNRAYHYICALRFLLSSYFFLLILLA